MARVVHILEGTITSLGFASGDRVVIGDWISGPIGPMVDIMWAKPSGERTLTATDQYVADFVSAIYRFDAVEIDDTLQTSAAPNTYSVSSARFAIDMALGRSLRIPFRRIRTPHVTRFVEHPIASRLLRVNTFGVTSTGIHEWYQADSIRRVTGARGESDGEALGALRPVKPPLAVGFSEPPSKPSSVRIRPRLYDPTGELDELIERLRPLRTV